MSDIRERIAFYEAIADAQDERDAAYATRAEDKERWDAAKHKYAQLRTYFRELYAAGNRAASADTVRPDPVAPEISTNGGNN